MIILFYYGNIHIWKDSLYSKRHQIIDSCTPLTILCISLYFAMEHKYSLKAKLRHPVSFAVFKTNGHSVAPGKDKFGWASSNWQVKLGLIW